MKNSMAVGVDVGGSHITAALVDLENRSVIEKTWRRERVNSKGTTTEIVDAWAAVILDVAAGLPHQPVIIGIGMPGPFNYEEGISLMQNQDKYDALYGLNVRELLAAKLNTEPQQIRFINDAGCFLQGEAFSGAARGFKSAIGLTLGTGLGSATFDGHIARDADRWCTPFKDSIAEEYISSRWFINRYAAVSGNAVKDVKALTELIGADPRILDIFQEFGTNLGTFLVPFIQEEQPEIVILGGNISNAADLFFPAVTAVLAQHNIHIPIRTAQLGESAAIIGAASVWYDETVDV
ncbi:ROK family protein [Chitinophaga sp. Cy-1792]|uniref:ROK family protein n=1 Tax=Chitinophaga sp. Cy-1792 TaxID=2608339 RepID=UPI00141FAD1D|nr:ROK family protein [Chitinophaga sp. Cy-1792]NIG55188.1 ROK family protein [Chitinophaga sp. Cy-1792]